MDSILISFFVMVRSKKPYLTNAANLQALKQPYTTIYSHDSLPPTQKKKKKRFDTFWKDLFFVFFSALQLLFSDDFLPVFQPTPSRALMIIWVVNLHVVLRSDTPTATSDETLQAAQLLLKSRLRQLVAFGAGARDNNWDFSASWATCLLVFRTLTISCSSRDTGDQYISW